MIIKLILYIIIIVIIGCDNKINMSYEFVKCYYNNNECVVEAKFISNWLCVDFLKNSDRANNNSPLGNYSCRPIN